MSVLGKKPLLELTRLVLEQVPENGAHGEKEQALQMSAPHLRLVQRTRASRDTGRQGWHRLAASPYPPPLGDFLWQEAGPGDLESLISPDSPEGTFVRSQELLTPTAALRGDRERKHKLKILL